MENVTVLELIVHVLRLSLISQNIACPFLGEFICQFVSFSCSVPRSTHLSSLERYNPTGNLRSECCRLLLWPAKNYVCTQLYGACKTFWHNMVTHPIHGLTWWSSSIKPNWVTLPLQFISNLLRDTLPSFYQASHIQAFSVCAASPRSEISKVDSNISSVGIPRKPSHSPMYFAFLFLIVEFLNAFSRKLIIKRCRRVKRSFQVFTIDFSH